jgi:hypothetical protein
MLLPERDEQLALAAEMVVQAAHAGVRPPDHLGDAGVGEPLLDEDRAGGVDMRTSTPGSWPGLSAEGADSEPNDSAIRALAVAIIRG